MPIASQIRVLISSIPPPGSPHKLRENMDIGEHSDDVPVARSTRLDVTGVSIRNLQ